MNNFQKKTVNEWLASVNGRRDWCVKLAPKSQPKESIQFIHDDYDDKFDINRMKFLRELDELMG